MADMETTPQALNPVAYGWLQHIGVADFRRRDRCSLPHQDPIRLNVCLLILIARSHSLDQTF